jgi:hypothetical protein
MKKTDLIEILSAKMAEEKQFLETMKNEQNPQIIELYNISKGRAEAYEAVIHYAKTGSKALL